MDTNVKLSNVIGAPFSDYVLLQLYIRAAHNSTINRSNEDILFLANKSGWARLVSSVNIDLQSSSNVLKTTPQDYQTYYSRFNLNSTLPYNAPDSLAKNWVLEAGTSIQNGNGINLRSGIGPDGAYGLGGTEELGYRPLPGLTSVQIETTGRLGSLRQATIQFKVWNMNQLNVVEALYFRLGYSMLLEWGHTQYFDNKDNFQRNEIYGITDPFAAGQRKELVQQAIALKARNSFGNYDGMLGIVSNFTWAMNQDGGYDCTVKLVGLGSVMDSMRINQTYTLPDGLVKEYKRSKDALAAALKDRIAALEKKLDDAKKSNTGSETVTVLPTPKSPAELRDRLVYYEKDSNTTIAQVQSAYGVTYYDQTSNFVAAASSNGKVTQGGHDYYTVFNSPNIPANVAAQIRTDYSGFYFNQSSTGFVRVPESGVSSVVVDTGLLNSAADALTFEVNGQQQTINNLINSNNTTVTKIFDYITQGKTGPSYIASYQFNNLWDAEGHTNASTYFSIVATTSQLPADKDFQPTRADIIKLLDDWQNSSSSTIDGVKITSTGKGAVLIEGTFTLNVKASYTGTASNKDIAIKGNVDGNALDNGTTRTVPVTFKFTTTNPGFISKVGPVKAPEKPATNTVETPNNGTENGTTNQANSSQTDATEGFASALQAMLTVIQAQAQYEGTKKDAIIMSVDTKAQTAKFFQDGIMNGVFDSSKTPKTIADPDNAEFDLVQYASKGFNSELMMNPSLYNSIPSVDFNSLCKAFILRYTQGGEEGGPSMIHAPVYIPFGYLLAFLNNMCLIYDSPESKVPTNANPATGVPKRPYVYIDFNPETNFCLTSPQQLSIDPLTCLIPFDANQTAYTSIFPENIVKNWSSDAAPLFNPDSNANVVSGVLHAAGLYYKSEGVAYQGKMMNILLNIDYLLDLVKSFAGSDAEHAVKLEPFLQQILADVNKALGNTNLFRVAYRDDSNTVQIQDDQWVPSLVGQETSMLTSNKYNSKLNPKDQPKLSGLLPISGDPKELPVVGNLGLARQFQLRSVMSTKLASMIAISAQAATGSVNAKDHSSLSYLNENFQDRYKPYIQDASNGSAGSNSNSKNKANGEANDQKAAEMFNEHVINVYSNFQLSSDRISPVKNYYIERMSKVKSGDPIVSAAPFIPAELEMTLDGISGIIMGNAFTVPQDRLPLSLRGENGLAKIAFIVTGLVHTIQNNEWLTKIKGQMIKLRQEVDIPKATTIVNQLQTIIASPQTKANNTISTIPWSAAFISYVMQQAGESNFPSNASHTGYAQSLRINPAGFYILNPNKETIKVGDLIVRNRNGNTLTFDSATWSGDSHGDIIINVSGNTATGIGGNVSNAVSKTSIGLVNGRLGRSDYFVILRPSSNVSNIVDTAVAEYRSWSTNQWKELTPAALPSLTKYYQTVKINL